MYVQRQVEDIEEEIVQRVNERARLLKGEQGHGGLTLEQIEKVNDGPYSSAAIQKLLNGLEEQLIPVEDDSAPLLHSRDHQAEDTVIHMNNLSIGNGQPSLIMGPCSVEHQEQMDEVAAAMSKRGVRLLRGGAFKPRTSPYDFQGLGIEGLKMLSEAARAHDMAVVTEIMSIDSLEEALPYVDIIQIGSRNMHNFDLLKAVGRVSKPVLLKRGLSATLKEFKLAAEYILAEGNPNVILCERGIRTYETSTRNTLDISAVPILKEETHLPVIVDISHSIGRKDIIAPIAKAALAAGADGIMTEVHPNPSTALSDAAQQLNLAEFNQLMDALE